MVRRINARIPLSLIIAKKLHICVGRRAADENFKPDSCRSSSSHRRGSSASKLGGVNYQVIRYPKTYSSSLKPQALPRSVLKYRSKTFKTLHGNVRSVI